MKEEPLVSIIMPVYNAEDFIVPAIDSVVSQNYENWELIVVNDGSTDNSKSLIESYIDSRIRFFSQVNAGVSAARNRGLSIMNGEFFCFLDSDDLLPKGSISERVAYMLVHDSVDFLDGCIEVWDKNFEELKERRVQKSSNHPFKSLCAIDNSVFFGITWMIRRRSVIDYRFDVNLSHGEDLLFYMLLCIDGGKYDAIDGVVYKCRSGNESAMSNLDGIWSGYQYIYNCLKSSLASKSSELLSFKRKITSIMFKSFLREGRLWDAMGVLLHYRRL